MGQVAREHGFAGKFLSALCDPATGLDIACKVLAAKLSAAAGGHSPQLGSLSAGEPFLARALALWNGGANPHYEPEVLARLSKYR